jgi:ubiquitin-protein ligase
MQRINHNMNNPRAIKRIHNDIIEYNKSPIDRTWIHQCEDAIHKIYLAIAGPIGSVYEDGIYFFVFEFTNNYPNEPPKGKFLNWQNSIHRMHPNMYANGLLCLSILGTWSGPSWTSAMTLSMIILSIQAIMDENPLVHEPGYEKNPGSMEHIKYQKIVEYYNNKDFIGKTIDMVEQSTPYIDSLSYLTFFKDSLRSFYESNDTRDRIIAKLIRLKTINTSKIVVSTSYRTSNATIDYTELYTYIIDKFTKK